MNPYERPALDGLTRRIIGGAFEVSNSLGCGFLEKVYENALRLELTAKGLLAHQQVPLRVTYLGQIVGEYTVDLVVEGTVLVELKSAREHVKVHEAQCLNYLRASGLPACLLLNFSQPRLGFRRFLHP